MAMNDLLRATFFPSLSRKGDGDAVDRLSSAITVQWLITAAVVISMGQLMVQPIQCYFPAQMTISMQEYVEKYCYVHETYFVPFEQRVSHVRRRGEKPAGANVINYYQWVPLILLLQAVLFFAPRFVWRVINGSGGVNFKGMMQMACQCLSCEGEKRNESYRSLADYIAWSIDLQRAARRRSSTYDVCSRLASVYNVCVYFLVKALYVLNAVGQIFLLDVLLQTHDPFFGINLLRNVTNNNVNVNGTRWQSSVFPRTTLCDVELRDSESGNPNRWTIQCVLVTNVFNEKLFMVLWLWIVFIFACSSSSFVCRLVSMCLPGNRRRFVRRLLPELPVDKDHPMAAAALTKFVDGYLGAHGVFLLRSIADRVGTIVASKVATYMWVDFTKKIPPRDPKLLVVDKKAADSMGNEQRRRPNEEARRSARDSDQSGTHDRRSSADSKNGNELVKPNFVLVEEADSRKPQPPPRGQQNHPSEEVIVRRRVETNSQFVSIARPTIDDRSLYDE